MKPLILFPHEVRRLADAGTVTVWRPMKLPTAIHAAIDRAEEAGL